jgi:hypothetical protein
MQSWVGVSIKHDFCVLHCVSNRGDITRNSAAVGGCTYNALYGIRFVGFVVMSAICSDIVQVITKKRIFGRTRSGWENSTKMDINPFKPYGNCMYHLL